MPLQLASPAAAAAYLGALAVAAFAFSSPVLIAGTVAAGAAAGLAAGVGPAVRLGLKIGVPMALLLVIVNGLVTSQGLTVLARLGDWPLLGRVDVTAESLAAGATIGLRAVAVTVIFAVYSAAVDPDRVLRALRPYARRSALTAGLVSRMVPLAIADASRLGEAARLRGPGAAAAGRAQLARRLLAGSLDRSVDVAATLELRGFGLPAGASKRRRRPRTERTAARRSSLESSRHDSRFYLAAAATVVIVIIAKVVGADTFSAYPRVTTEFGPAGVAVVLATVAVGLAPLRVRVRRAGRRSEAVARTAATTTAAAVPGVATPAHGNGRPEPGEPA